MTAYNSYLSNTMKTYIPSDEDLERGFSQIPKVDL